MMLNKKIIATALLLTVCTQFIIPVKAEEVKEVQQMKEEKQLHYQIKEFKPNEGDSYWIEALGVYGHGLSKTFYNPDKTLKKYKYSYKDSADNKYVQKIPLKDGDYVVFKTKLKNWKDTYAAEYHKDGSLMGIVGIRMKKYPRHGYVALSGMEYRLNDKSEFELKHIIYVKVMNDKSNIVTKQYFYRPDKTLICYLEGDTIYVSKKSDNLILKDLYVPGIEQSKIPKPLLGASQTLAYFINPYSPFFLITLPLALIHLNLDHEAYDGM